MSHALKAMVVLDSNVDRQLVEKLLTSSQRLTVLEYFDLERADWQTEGGDVVVVACTRFSEEVGSYVEQASRLRPQRPVVLLAHASSNGYVAEAFRHGAEDIFTLPEEEDPAVTSALARDLLFTLEKAVARRRGAHTTVEHGLGEMICVLGLKGGSGKTLTAANLAVALAAAGKKVAVVDLDLQFGDIGLALGLTPDRTLYDLARTGGSLDSDKLADFMTEHPSGVRALLAPTRPDQAGVITADFLRGVFGVLRGMTDFAIVDTPPGFTPEVIAAVDSSTAVCMVAMLDSLSLKNTKLGFETLELMDYASDKVMFVLNRADSKVGISPEDVVSILGRPPSVLIPSDRDVTRSINQGEPIALANRRSDAARAFNALAQLYLTDSNGARPQPAGPKRRLFGRR
jgi:pilus assembly protein CpaE